MYGFLTGPGSMSGGVGKMFILSKAVIQTTLSLGRGFAGKEFSDGGNNSTIKRRTDDDLDSL
jgi:hypothetical protein